MYQSNNQTPSSRIWGRVYAPSFGVLFVVIVFFVFGDDIRTDYWQMQSSWFIATNHFLANASPVIWANITELGDAVVLFPFTFILISRFPSSFAALWASVPIAAATSIIFKYLASVPRPARVISGDEFNIIGPTLKAFTSFPSGHTITIFTAVVAILSSLFPNPTQQKQWWLIGLGLFFAGLVGLSRIAVGAHWPMDIVGGAICGWFAGVLGAKSVYLSRWWVYLLNPKFTYYISFVMLAWSLAILVRSIGETDVSVIYIFSASSGILASLKYLLENSENPVYKNSAIRITNDK